MNSFLKKAQKKLVVDPDAVEENPGETHGVPQEQKAKTGDKGKGAQSGMKSAQSFAKKGTRKNI
jgi:hypothetical protein